MWLKTFSDQAPFNRESVAIGLMAAASSLIALNAYPRFALLAPVLVFGWTQISSG